jgi:murein DD-endopeptidase MepM/ murein hydrolase activator NlpD
VDTATRVEIMRAGHLGRWAVLACAALMTGACSQPTGVAGVSAETLGTPPVTSSPSVTGTIPQPTATIEQQAAVTPPTEDPVKIPPPKVSKYTYAFPVRDCKTTYQHKLIVLPKTTIWAKKGCAFVAPVDGVVDEVNLTNRWSSATDVGADREGRFVTIIGDDGVRYLGGHLDSVADGVKPGAKVNAGQTLGKVGNTGNAQIAGSNLYFAISWKTGPAYWWVRRGMVNPWGYLDAWKKGNRTLSPKDETLKLRGKLGETPSCSVQCASKTVQEPDTTTTKKKKKKKPTSHPTPTPIIINP